MATEATKTQSYIFNNQRVPIRSTFPPAMVCSQCFLHLSLKLLEILALWQGSCSRHHWPHLAFYQLFKFVHFLECRIYFSICICVYYVFSGVRWSSQPHARIHANSISRPGHILQLETGLWWLTGQNQKKRRTRHLHWASNKQLDWKIWTHSSCPWERLRKTIYEAGNG